MEYESEREKAIFEQGLEEGRLQKKREIAYHMHDKGYENWYIAAMLDESKQTIEQSITPPKSPTIGEACKEARNSVPC